MRALLKDRRRGSKERGLVSKLSGLVSDVTGPGQFKVEGEPSVREIWRWVKNLFQDFVDLKQRREIERAGESSQLRRH